MFLFHFLFTRVPYSDATTIPPLVFQHMQDVTDIQTVLVEKMSWAVTHNQTTMVFTLVLMMDLSLALILITTMQIIIILLMMIRQYMQDLNI